MKKSLIALGFGTLGLGIAEFVMMAILPYVARDLHVGIPAAGHLISAYALGVCAGAPMLTLARKWPLKHILLGLIALMMIGNIFAGFSPTYGWMLVARFISGFPHGAYFGVASILAEKLADKGKGSEAVSIMIAGMTIANLFGVPLGTSLSTLLSWRLTFLLVGAVGVAVLYYIWKWVPHVEGLPDTGFKGQFRFLKTTAPWLILGATMLGNGSVFCWYSYINPFLTKIAGFSTQSIPFLMVLAGFGMVVGNLVGGRLADKYTPGRVAAAMQFLIFLTLVFLFFDTGNKWLTVLLMCVCTMGLFAVSSPLQISIIHFAKGGELFGAACIQVAFNLGNALGATLGGLPLKAGMGYQYTALAGAPFALSGVIFLTLFFRKYELKGQNKG